MHRNRFAGYCCPRLFNNNCAEADEGKLFVTPFVNHCLHCGGRLFKLFREKTRAEQEEQKRKQKNERQLKRAQEVRETLQLVRDEAEVNRQLFQAPLNSNPLQVCFNKKKISY